MKRERRISYRAKLASILSIPPGNPRNFFSCEKSGLEANPPKSASAHFELGCLVGSRQQIPQPPMYHIPNIILAASKGENLACPLPNSPANELARAVSRARDSELATRFRAKSRNKNKTLTRITKTLRDELETMAGLFTNGPSKPELPTRRMRRSTRSMASPKCP